MLQPRGGSPHALNSVYIRVEEAFAQYTLALHAGCTKKQDVYRLTIPFFSKRTAIKISSTTFASGLMARQGALSQVTDRALADQAPSQPPTTHSATSHEAC
jgi:hypothetical protein